MKSSLLSILLTIVCILPAFCNSSEGPKIGDLDIQSLNWNSVKVNAQVKPAFYTSGTAVPIIRTVKVSNLQGDVLYEGSADEPVQIPDESLGNREELILSYCANQGQASSCKTHTLFASPKVALVDATIEYPYKNDLTKGKFHMNTRIVRTNFFDASQTEEIISKGQIKAQVLIKASNGQLLNVPVSSESGVFNLKYRSSAQPFLQNQMEAVYNNHKATFSTSIVGSIAGISFTKSQDSEIAFASITKKPIGESLEYAAARIIPIPEDILTAIPSAKEKNTAEVINEKSSNDAVNKTKEKAKPAILKTQLTDEQFANAALPHVVKMITSDPVRSQKVQVVSSNETASGRNIKLQVDFVDKWTDARLSVKGNLIVNQDGSKQTFKITSTNKEVKLMADLGEIKLKKNHSWK